MQRKLNATPYIKGIKLTDAELAAIAVNGNVFYPEWN